MAYRDLREFLEVLRAHGELIEVARRVELAFEVGKALRATGAVGGPAVLFSDNGTAFPLVGGIFNSRSKALLAFEASEAGVLERILAGLARPVPPVRINSAAPCQEIIREADAADLRALPIPTYSPADGGPFITPGIVVSRDPETGVPDIGHYRFQILGAQSMSFLAQPFHRFGKHIAKARRLGLERYPAAIVLGCEPILAYACTVQVPDGTDDFAIAGGLRGAPVELVRCRTVDVEVPAHAEIVIEFSVDLTREVDEGPLGEYTGYYTPVSKKPLALLSAITHRRGAIAQALLTGIPPTENHILKQLPFEASFLQTLRAQFPTVERVAIPPSGGVSFYVVVAMRPRYNGEARHVILSALSSNIRPKYVIVVEPDVDVHNPAEVEWALSFRVQPQRDVMIVDGLPAGPLDPSVDESVALDRRTASAIGIDATRPFGGAFPDVADVPGWQEYDFPELRAALRGSSVQEVR